MERFLPGEPADPRWGKLPIKRGGGGALCFHPSPNVAINPLNKISFQFHGHRMSLLSTCLLGGRFMAITQNLTAPGCPTLSPVFHLCPGHPPSWNLSAVSSHQPSMCPLALFPLSCPFSGLVPSALLVLPLSPVSGALPAILYPSSLHSQPCSVPWALQSQFR